MRSTLLHCLVLMAVQPAFGQQVPGASSDSAPGAGAEPAPSVVLEEVVVTSGFRERDLLDLPASVTVLDEVDLEAVAAKHVESVVALAPNVTFSSGASRSRFFQIRGIGDLEQFVDPKHYPSVGLSVDGINLGGVAGAAMLFDAERVEVLRGPQGTRFGTSALAGLINVRSRRPERDFGGYITAGLADYGTTSIGAVLNGPLTSTVAGRVAVQKHAGDGYYRNGYLNVDDTNRYDERTVRASLAFEPRSRNDVLSDGRYEFSVLDFQTDNGYDAFSLDNTRTTLSDDPGFDRQSGTTFSGQAKWSLPDESRLEVTLTHLDADSDYGFDEDWTYAGICDGTLCDPVFDFFSNTDSYSRQRQETTLDARWLSTVRADWDVVAGLFLQGRSEDLSRSYYGIFESDYSTDRVAAYGQLSLPIRRDLEFTAGLRVERFDDDYIDSFGAALASGDTLSTGEIALTYSIDDNITVFGLLARGEKAGGVNTEASANAPFMQPQFQQFLADRLRIEPEALTSLEFGLRGQTPAGRLSWRASLFKMHRSKAQLESWIWDSVNFLWVGLLDSADGRNTGFELEFDALIGEQWLLSTSLGLLDTRVESMQTFDLDQNVFVEKSGIDQAKAPDWQVSVAADWRPPGAWSARLELQAQNSQRFGYYHEGRLEAYSIVHASVVRQFDQSALRLYVRNLLDEDVPVHGLYFGNDPRKAWVNETYLQFGEPRIIGVELNYSF